MYVLKYVYSEEGRFNMNVGNIKVDVKNSPVLEPEFVPMGAYMDAYEKNATEPIAIAVYRESGNVSVYDTKIYGTEEMFEDDLRYVERIVKFMLWAAGGFKVVICGSAKIYEALKQSVADGAGILNIICGAAAFSWLVTMMGMTNALSHVLTSMTDNKYIMLLVKSILQFFFPKNRIPHTFF